MCDKEYLLPTRTGKQAPELAASKQARIKTYCRHPSPIQTVLSALESHQILHPAASCKHRSGRGARGLNAIMRSPPVGNFTLPRRNVKFLRAYYTVVSTDLTIGCDTLPIKSQHRCICVRRASRQTARCKKTRFPSQASALHSHSTLLFAGNRQLDTPRQTQTAESMSARCG